MLCPTLWRIPLLCWLCFAEYVSGKLSLLNRVACQGSPVYVECFLSGSPIYEGYCGIAHSDNHSITHIMIFIVVLKSYSCAVS